MAYLHPDKVAAVSKALKKPKRKKKPAASQPAHPGLVRALAVKLYSERANGQS